MLAMPSSVLVTHHPPGVQVLHWRKLCVGQNMFQEHLDGNWDTFPPEDTYTCLGLQHALGRTLTLNALVSERVAGTWMVRFAGVGQESI